MVGLYCAVSGCNNNLAKCRSLGLLTTFHRFPLNPSLREIWTDSCNRGKDWNKPNVFMCSEHFTPSDFLHSKTERARKRAQLVKGAVPTRNLPASRYICCTSGCDSAAPAILVKRFPKEISGRVELLSGFPRKEGLSLIDSYPCEKHVALKQFLKGEVERIALVEDEQDEDIVIFEVSTVGGKPNSTKLIEPRAKKRKVQFSLENGESAEELQKCDDLTGTSEKVVEPVEREDEALDCEISSSQAEESDSSEATRTKSLPPSSSSIAASPLPVLVKNGDSSQLMFLHHSPRLRPESSPKPGTLVNSNSPRLDKSCGTPPASGTPDSTHNRTTGDLLVDRLYRRIQELEERLATQRNNYKKKMAEKEDQYSTKIKELNSRVKELKSELHSFNKVHKNIVKKGLVRPVTQSAPKPSQSISWEVHKILERSFTSNQIKKIINESEPVRWTNYELLLAYTLKHLSYGAYTFVRNELKYPLPSPNYLGRWLAKVDREKMMSHPITDLQPASESQNEIDGEFDLAGESVKTDNPCGQVTLGEPANTASGVEFELGSEDDEGMEDGQPNSEDIVIIADPEGSSSNSIQFSHHDQVPSKNFQVYYALHSSKDSLSSPNVYVLDNTKETVQIQKVISGSEDLNEQTDDDEMNRFEQILIVDREQEETDSHSSEV